MNYKKLALIFFVLLCINLKYVCAYNVSENKKRSFFIFYDIFFNHQNDRKTTKKNFTIRDVFLGPALAVFHSRDILYKNIHQKETATPIIQLQADISEHFSLWSDLGFMYNEGHYDYANIIHANTKAKIYHIFFGTGIKAKHYFKKDANIFLKIGPSFIHYRLKSNSPSIFPSIPKVINKHGFGCTFGTGIQAPIKNNFYFNLFADYMLNRRTTRNDNFPNHSTGADIGGILTGIGLQYKF